MTSIYLVRHAKALDRATWVEPDHLRPLSNAGRRQARALPEHLGERGFSRLVTSPYVRCVQTFEPLAEEDGSTLELVEWLAEGAPADDALELLVELAATAPVAACTHGDVILATLATLGASGVPVTGPLDCKKGSTWVLRTHDGTLVEASYLEPPSSAKGG